jgi:hypothetical protein
LEEHEEAEFDLQRFLHGSGMFESG